MAPRLIAIVGPTAAGKSALALRLAAEHAVEIVSCDSLQVYRGIDIGSAKASPEERRRVRHHLLDVVDPSEGFSAADYSRLARASIRDVAARGALPIVVGGSGLYFRALFRGLFAGPPRDRAFRERLERLAERFGDARLHRVLRRVDPAAADRIPMRDRVRVVRALEVFRETGRPISAHHREGSESLTGFDTFVIGLNPDRDALRGQVERRTRQMFASGLLGEVRGLLDRGHAPDLKPLQAIGYRQALEILRGERSEEEAILRVTTETMRYAKRQMTWFRREPVTWFADPESAFAAITRWLRTRAAGS